MHQHLTLQTPFVDTLIPGPSYPALDRPVGDASLATSGQGVSSSQGAWRPGSVPDSAIKISEGRGPKSYPPPSLEKSSSEITATQRRLQICRQESSDDSRRSDRSPLSPRPQLCSHSRDARAETTRRLPADVPAGGPAGHYWRPAYRSTLSGFPVTLLFTVGSCYHCMLRYKPPRTPIDHHGQCARRPACVNRMGTARLSGCPGS